MKMKINVMKTICETNKGICKDCILNCIENWQEKGCTWCLLLYRQETIEKYNKYKKENNEIMMLKVQKDYEEIERKYLKQ